MAVTKLAGTANLFPWLLAAPLFLWQCSKKNEPQPPPPPAQAPALPPQPPAPKDTAPVIDTSAADSSAPALKFWSRPSAEAYPRHAYIYKPVFSLPGPVRLRVVKGPDSLAIRGDKVIWSPEKTGTYPVELEAAWKGEGASDTLRARQSYSIAVREAISLSLKPIPHRIKKGGTVVFDLSGSKYPEWARSSATVRFDYDGDGKWDSSGSLAAETLHKHAYTETGRFFPGVEASVNGETHVLRDSVVVVSDVDASLKISPDTVEPGENVTLDASASKGDGRLVFHLDVDGDGKFEALDSLSGKWSLKAPSPGRYHARLSVVNGTGQEGTATAELRVNAKPKLDIKVKNPRDNMAAPVVFEVRGRDSDDSIRQVKIKFGADSSGWEAREAPDTARGPGDWMLRFSHVYGKVGRFEPTACLMSADGRGACAKSSVEIFNAPPECPAAPDVHATLGKPVEIDGVGTDPDGKIVKWEWDLNGDGKFDLASKTDGKLKYTFAKEGRFSLVLKVTTADGMTAMRARRVDVRKK
jgi:hypothetical protein